jgi:hypothetical protein
MQEIKTYSGNRPSLYIALDVAAFQEKMNIYPGTYDHYVF